MKVEKVIGHTIKKKKKKKEKKEKKKKNKKKKQCWKSDQQSCLVFAEMG